MSIESDRGDPQKTGPCGGSNTDWGKPSYVISKVVGGQKLHLKVQDTMQQIFSTRHLPAGEWAQCGRPNGKSRTATNFTTTLPSFVDPGLEAFLKKWGRSPPAG